MYEVIVYEFKMYEITVYSFTTSIQNMFVSQPLPINVHLRSYGAAISAIASADAPWPWALQLLNDMRSNSVEDGAGFV